MRLSDFQRKRFIAACAHALPHRRSVAPVADLLANYVNRAAVQRKRSFFTHCHISRDRDRQHRNTSRAIIHELAELGFVQLDGFRYWNNGNKTYCNTRFTIRMKRVLQYATDNAIGPYTYQRPREAQSKIRTASQWWAERKAYRKRKADMVVLRAAKEAAERAMQRAAERTPAEARRRGLAAVRAALPRSGAMPAQVKDRAAVIAELQALIDEKS